MAIYKVTTADLEVNVSASSNIKYPTNVSVFRSSDVWRSDDDPTPTPTPPSGETLYYIEKNAGAAPLVTMPTNTANVSKIAFSMWINLKAYATGGTEVTVDKASTDIIRIERYNYDYGGGDGAREYVSWTLKNGGAAYTRIAIDIEAILGAATEWFHAFAWYDGSKIGGGDDAAMKFFINGSQQGATVNNMAAGGAVTAEYNVCDVDTWLFSREATAYWFTGAIGQFRMFWDGIAGWDDDATAIATYLYNSGMGRPTTVQGVIGGLAAEYLFEDAYSTPIGNAEIIDTSSNGTNSTVVDDIDFGGTVTLNEV